jgi:ubiquinone/menaquinone biosynthesis C-methylase UbiE
MGRDAYAIRAHLYDRFLEPQLEPVRRAADRLFPVQPGWVVLDVGCGTGTALAELAQAGCHVIGTDTSSAMIGVARDRLGPEADLRLGDGTTLPVADASVDLVRISLVLHSVDRGTAVALLRESARALVPGGAVLVIDFGTDGLRFPRGHLTRGFTALAEVAAGPSHAGHAVSYLRGGGLRGLLAEAGLEVRAHRPTAGGNLTVAVVGPPG